MKKKNLGGARGGKHILSLENSSQKQNKKKEKSLVFNPPRGARTFHHTSKLYQSVSR